MLCGAKWCASEDKRSRLDGCNFSLRHIAKELLRRECSKTSFSMILRALKIESNSIQESATDYFKLRLIATKSTLPVVW